MQLIVFQALLYSGPNARMTWPPTNNFDNFITKVLSGSLPNYDPKELEAINSENTRYAGHCLLWSKTDLVFKTRIQDVPMRALFMVSMLAHFIN